MNRLVSKKISGMSVIYGSISYFILSHISMYFYPGGTPWDPSKIGYTYWENFLSDLGETIAKNGEPNLYSMILSNSAIIVFGISICIFYFNYSTFICKKKWVGWITSGSGILSGGGLILLGITPSNTFKSFQLFGVYLWALGLFCVLLITVIYKNDEYSNYLLSFTTLLLIFIGYHIFQGLTGVRGIPITIVQKIVFNLNVIWYLLMGSILIKNEETYKVKQVSI